MEKASPLSQTYKTMDRRSFIRLSGLLGLGLASAAVVPTGAEAVRFNAKTYKISKTRLAMGTFVSMTLIHPSKDKAQEAMGLAFEEIDRLTHSMSRFDTATALAQLNKEGTLNDLPPELAQVIERALRYYRLSNGTFDISVKPVVDLFRDGFLQGNREAPPDEKALKEALHLVGAHNIELRGRTVRFKRPGMGITLDGIAKGYIVDRASKILTRHGIENHLINAGGDIKATGGKGGKKSWTVAIQDPKKQKHYPDIIHIRDGAIATSGNYEIYFDKEKMFHHIVNPKTGLSPRLTTSVSVLAETAMDADALSTALFVMEPETAIRFINGRTRSEALIITEEETILKSRHWKGRAT